MNAIFTHANLATEAKLNFLQRTILVLLAEKFNDKLDILPQKEFKPGLRANALWEKWISEATKENDILVLTTLRIGKATQKLANQMLVKDATKVFFFNGLKLENVRFIQTLDAENWRQGWQVVYGLPKEKTDEEIGNEDQASAGNAS